MGHYIANIVEISLRRRLFTLIALSAFAVSSAHRQSQGEQLRPAFLPIEDNPALPRILIIGDSISIGYTLPVRDALKGVANVHRPPENCESTVKGLEKIDQWLGDDKWDVIHFNWGLHDLKYVNESGKKVLPPEGKQVTPPKQYAENLEALVRRLKQTGAGLVWRPTTPVPEGAEGRIRGDEVKYNNIALLIMNKYGIMVDDLNSFIKSKHIQHSKPDNVHFTKAGYEAMAQRIARTIKKALADPQPDKRDRVNEVILRLPESVEVDKGLV